MSELKISHSNPDNPFSPSKRFRYYATPELGQRIEQIRQLIQEDSEQLLLVLAEAGYGKTTLLNQLSKIANKECKYWWLYTLKGNPTLSSEAIISELLIAFNVDQKGKSSQWLQDSLHNHIAAARYNAQLPVLFIDDADKLPLNTLKFIIGLALIGKAVAGMKVLLFAEPQLIQTLRSDEFDRIDNSLMHILDLPAFSDTQVRDYLKFCLQGSQYKRSHLFSRDIIKMVYTESNGVVGEVNRLAQQVLHQSIKEQKPNVSTSPSHSQSFWGIIIVFVIVITMLLFGDWNSPSPPQKTSQPFPIEEALRPSPIEASQSLNLPVLSDHNLYDHTFTTNEKTETFTNGERRTVNNLTSQEANVTIPTTPFSAKEKRDTLPIQPHLPSYHQGEPLSQPSQTETLISSPPKEKADHLPIQLSYNQEVQYPQLSQTEIKGENWLLRQNSEAYTLQILGLHDRFALKQFLDQHQLTTDVAMFKTIHRNKDWYAIVYGIYPTHQQAVAALKALPASLKKNTKPWIRRLSDIQKQIH